MPQYQSKQISTSMLIRPRYGVLRTLSISSVSSKIFTFHKATTEEECTDENEIIRIARPNAPVNYPNLNIPFTSLFAKVTIDTTDDGSKVLIQID